jgi:hypothetical protein
MDDENPYKAPQSEAAQSRGSPWGLVIYRILWDAALMLGCFAATALALFAILAVLWGIMFLAS